jgi:DNA mismatch repair protein MutS
METLGVLNLEGFGLAPTHAGLGPAGALVYYATENLCAKPENLRSLQEYRSTARCCSIRRPCATSRSSAPVAGRREGSLLHAINRTVTAAGARLLERWLAAPTLDLPEIRRRQTLVGELLGQPTRLADMHDAPRQASATSPAFSAACRTACATRANSAASATPSPACPPPRHPAAYGAPLLFPTLRLKLQELPALRQLLASALADELPNDLADGNYIRAGHDAELDRLRSLTTDNKTWLSDLERGEQERTGIRSLKVRFTNNFGYYIEVTKANLHLVPADYIRRQTTVGGERYVTEALKQKEKEIFHAEENALARELELFNQLVAAVLDDSIALAQTADALAEIDVLAGWALLAREWDYACPELDDGDTLEIIEGRHPVVEQVLRSPDTVLARGGSAAFVPNDTLLACDDAQIALLTGPNMAGKSTYIRQVALITLMAQVGCWVPAKSCRVGLVDRIFSRVGASDDLARGNSTFMVEMNETANILNNATDRSLIILDEIGRGTSTYDGLSIAWAVVEHLHRDADRGRARSFATHYQELTQLEKHLPRLRNFSVAVKEWNDEIVFVRRVDSRRRRPQLRHPGRPPRGPAAQRHRPREDHPRATRERRRHRFAARAPGEAKEKNHGGARGRLAAQPVVILVEQPVPRLLSLRLGFRRLHLGTPSSQGFRAPPSPCATFKPRAAMPTAPWPAGSSWRAPRG